MVQGKRPLAIQWELTQSGKAQPSLIFREPDLEAGSCKRPDKAKAAETIPKTERETHTILLTILLVVLTKQQHIHTNHRRVLLFYWKCTIFFGLWRKWHHNCGKVLCVNIFFHTMNILVVNFDYFNLYHYLICNLLLYVGFLVWIWKGVKQYSEKFKTG